MSSVLSLVHTKKMPKFALPLFVLVLFCVSWLGSLPMILQSYQPKNPLPVIIKFLQIFMFFGPLFTTLGFSIWLYGKSGPRALMRGFFRFRSSYLIWFLVLLGPGVIMLMGNRLGLPHSSLPHGVDILVTFGQVCLGYFLLNTEEFAWRGFLLPHLLKDATPLRASLLVGVLWVAFHIPLFFLKGGHPARYPMVFLVFMGMSLSLVFSLVYLRSSGSIFLVHLGHQTFNAWGEAIPTFPVFTGSLIPMAIDVALICLLGLLAAILLNKKAGAKDGDSSSG